MYEYKIKDRCTMNIDGIQTFHLLEYQENKKLYILMTEVKRQAEWIVKQYGLVEAFINYAEQGATKRIKL